MKKMMPALIVLAIMAVIVSVVYVVLLRPAQHRQRPAPGAKAGSFVRIISPHNEGILTEFKHAFEAWHQEKCNSPCTVEWEDRGGASTIRKFVAAELASSAEMQLDILWGGGAPYYETLAEAGRLAPYKLPPEILRTLPAKIAGVPVYDAQYRWYGSALSSFGILYNRERFAEHDLPEPNTWEDLGRPEYFNEVSVADPRKSGSACMMVEIILQVYGWEKGMALLTRMAGNARQFRPASSDITQDVARQDAAAGLAIDFYGMKTVRHYGRENIWLVLPTGLTPITPDPIAIFKDAPNPEGARRFVEFVMSEAGQKLWILPPGAPGGPREHDLMRIPAAPEIFKKYTAESTARYDPELLNLTFEYDPVLRAARDVGIQNLYGAIFIDCAPELKAAWKAVIARGLKPKELKKLCTPPVSAAELLEFSRKDWSDDVLRNRKLAMWSREARRRYKQLAR